MRHVQSPCDPEHVRLRCLIVDDSEAFLAAASMSLARDGIEVLDTASTSAEALRFAQTQRPDVVLVDVNLGGESGFDLARTLVERFPELGSSVVLISTREERDYGGLIAASPAVGFLRKTELSAKALREMVSATASDPWGMSP
jgi:DNA-binding NarL/FixJ family response regulator